MVRSGIRAGCCSSVLPPVGKPRPEVPADVGVGVMQLASNNSHRHSQETDDKCNADLHQPRLTSHIIIPSSWPDSSGFIGLVFLQLPTIFHIRCASFRAATSAACTSPSGRRYAKTGKVILHARLWARSCRRGYPKGAPLGLASSPLSSSCRAAVTEPSQMFWRRKVTVIPLQQY